MSIVHSAVYRDGRRVAADGSLEETLRALDEARSGEPEGSAPGARRGGFAWFDLRRPEEQELRLLQERFDLHRLVLEDALSAHLRPRVGRCGSTVLTALRPVVGLADRGQLRFGQLRVVLGPGVVLTVHDDGDGDGDGHDGDDGSGDEDSSGGEHGAGADGAAELRERLESDPELLHRGPAAVLCAAVERVVEGYAQALDGVSADLDRIEEDLFAGRPRVSPRIYHLARQVSAFHRAAQPLPEMLETAGDSELVADDEELGHRLRRVREHALGVTHRIEAFRTSLTDAMQLDSTLTAGRQNDVAVQLNEQTKKISSWAAILVAPTLIAGIYGMNFEHMPELGWDLGYVYSLGLMLASSAALYLVFKRRGWL